jgi:hypothetical protein
MFFPLWGLVRLILREKDWEKIISHYNIYEINYFQIPFNSLEEGINWTRLEWGNSFVESYIPIISIILFAKVLGKKVTFLNWLQHIKKKRHAMLAKLWSSGRMVMPTSRSYVPDPNHA